MAAGRRVRKYKILLPRDTTVVTACEDAGCERRARGWETVCDESTAQGATVAAWIRSGQSGRTWAEVRTGPGEPSVFRFEAGQRCFAEHRTRPARFIAAGQEVPRLHEWGEHLAGRLGDLQDQLAKG